MHTMDEMTRAGCTSRRGIRHWEEIGLLGDVARSSGDTRQYTTDQLDRARIIAAAAFGGWKLDDIRGMLNEFHVGPEVYDAIHTRLTQQIQAAARLGEALPVPMALRATTQEYDL